VIADLFGLQQLVATSLWGSAVMQSPFFALQNRAIKLLEFQYAVQEQAVHRYKKFLQGYIRYKQVQETPRRLHAPIVKQIGNASLRDYGALYGVSPQAKPVLVVPSLINQPSIFDLCPGYSLFEYMVKNQLHPFLIDWGRVDDASEHNHLEELLNSILFTFADVVRDYTLQKQISLAGYCMGGLFALLAAQNIACFDRIALLATPWDFHAGTPRHQRELLIGMIQQELNLKDHVSAFCLQLLFHIIDPTAAIRKFALFADIPDGTPAYYRFLALEHWVNDVNPLPRMLAEEIFGNWYRDNIFAVSKKIFGQPLNQNIPTLMIQAEQDRIVPLSATQALETLLPQAQALTVPLGHVGLLVSERAKNMVWQPLVDWLK
jgi:poly(3-hydroxyalkanoate) synthetase